MSSVLTLLSKNAMKRALFLSMLLLGVACQKAKVESAPADDRLYYAIEVKQAGQPVASPKVVGFSGKSVAVQHKAQGAAEPDYEVWLKSEERAGGYQLALRLRLPSGSKEAQLKLKHGEERTLDLGEAVELKVLLLKVDSREFRALMALARGTVPGVI
jgi:hypothetical protein